MVLGPRVFYLSFGMSMDVLFLFWCFLKVFLGLLVLPLICFVGPFKGSIFFPRFLDSGTSWEQQIYRTQLLNRTSRGSFFTISVTCFHKTSY